MHVCQLFRLFDSNLTSKGIPDVLRPFAFCVFYQFFLIFAFLKNASVHGITAVFAVRHLKAIEIILMNVTWTNGISSVSRRSRLPVENVICFVFSSGNKPMLLGWLSVYHVPWQAWDIRVEISYDFRGKGLACFLYYWSFIIAYVVLASFNSARQQDYLSCWVVFFELSSSNIKSFFRKLR